MSGFTITATGTKGTIQLSSNNGASVSSQAYIAIGCPYTVSVAAPVFGGCPLWNVTKVVYTYANGKGVVIRARNPDTGKTLTQFTFDQGMIEGASYVEPTYDFQSSYTWTLQNPSSTAAISLFMGIPVGTYGQYQDTLSVHAYYDNGVDEVATFTVNIETPYAAPPNDNKMTFSCPTCPNPPVGSPNGWQFGPFIWYKIINQKDVYQFSPVPWDDIGYFGGVSGTNYSFGVFTPGIAPWQTTAQVNNTTHSDGDFFLVQLGSLWNCQKQWYEPAQNLGDGIIRVPDNVADPTSQKQLPKNLIPYLDNDPNDPGPVRAPYAFQSVVSAPAQSGPLQYPQPNTIHDLNGNLVNYSYDNPSEFMEDVGLTNSTGGITLAAPYQLYFNFDIYTYLCFQSEGGIPIGLAAVNWMLTCTQDNSTVAKNGSWVQARTMPALWVGAINAQLSSIAFGPYYLTWPYVCQYSLKSATPAYKKRGTPNPGAPSGVQNSGPIGGLAQMQGNTGRGLPNGIAGNVSVANLSGMN